MPRRSKGPRLWLEPARRDSKGRILRRAVFVIRDGSIKRSTGFGEGEIEEAQRALAEYQIARYSVPRDRDRDAESVKVADVISIYAEDVAVKHARPRETAARLDRLLDFFGDQTLIRRSDAQEHQQANLRGVCRCPRIGRRRSQRVGRPTSGHPVPLGERLLHGVDAGRSS